MKVTQTEKNAVARNLVLRDLIQSEDAVLDKESVAIYDQNGVKLDRPEIEATEKGYTIHTGMDLAYQEYLLVQYQMTFSEKKEEGEILNVALATTDNLRPEEETPPDPVSVGDGLTA